MGIGYDAHIRVAAANAQWKGVIREGAVDAPAVTPRSKCPGCGSWDYQTTADGLVCSYCRIPSGHSGKQRAR